MRFFKINKFILKTNIIKLKDSTKANVDIRNQMMKIH